MAQKPETVFRNNQVMPFLRSLPECYKVSIQQVALVGIPDLLICLGGYFVGMELKDITGKASPSQLYNLGKIRDAGGLAMICDKTTWKKDRELLTALAVRKISFAEARAGRPNFSSPS